MEFACLSVLFVYLFHFNLLPHIRSVSASYCGSCWLVRFLTGRSMHWPWPTASPWTSSHFQSLQPAPNLLLSCWEVSKPPLGGVEFILFSHVSGKYCISRMERCKLFTGVLSFYSINNADLNSHLHIYMYAEPAGEFKKSFQVLENMENE